MKRALTNAELNRMTLTQFRQLPAMPVAWDAEVRCSNVVLLPNGQRHTSGWGMMDFVPILDGRILGRISDCVDDVAFDRHLEVPGDLRVDCLHRSRLLNFWRSDHYIVIRHRVSSTRLDFERRDP